MLHLTPPSQQSPFSLSPDINTHIHTCSAFGLVCGGEAHTYKPKAFQLAPGARRAIILACGGLLTANRYRYQHTRVCGPGLGPSGVMVGSAAILKSRSHHCHCRATGSCHSQRPAIGIRRLRGWETWAAILGWGGGETPEHTG